MAKSKTITSKSTIMFTDIVGYSQMVAKDEKWALELLDEHNNIIFPIIKNHDGEIIKLIGDAIFARYLSSKNSVFAAIEIQNKLKDRNTISKNNEAIKIRVGLHAGEVIEKDDDLFGHDVNLCSRIESVTQSGSITISEEIFEAVEKIDGLFHRKIGHVKLKNIPEPKMLYKTYLDLLDFNEETDEKLYNSFIDRGVEVVDIKKYKAEQIISLGVLYFTNLGKESDEYFCYNFTKDLIDNLRSVNSLRVPSINEISKFKNTELNKSDIARKLEVDRLILGSLFVDNNQANLNLELIDINSGKSLWNTSLNIDLNKTLHIHNQILDKILEIIGIDTPDHLKKKFVIQSTDNPEAEKEYKKARYLMKIQKKKEDLLIAEKHLNTAIKHDPKFLFAHTCRGVVSMYIGDYERAEEMLNFALEIAKKDGSNISNGYVYSFLGDLYNLWSKYNLALKYNKLALEVWAQLNDHLTEATIINNLGLTYQHLGELEKALKYYTKSLQIKQKYEDRLLQGTSIGQIGSIYLAQFNYSVGISYLNSSISIFDDFNQNFKKGLSLLFITEAYIETGQLNIARRILNESESVLDEYKHPTINGRLSLYRGLIDFYNSDIGGAISHIENSIHQYQSAQKSVPAFNSYLQLIDIYIFKYQFDKAKVTVDKIDILVNKIKDNEILIRYRTIKYLINILDDKVDEKNLNEIVDQLTVENNDMQHYFTYWYLSLIFSLNNNSKNAEKYLLQSQKLLIEKSKQDADKTLWDAILHTNPINNQIITQKVGSLKVFTDSLAEKTIKVEVDKFCTECGYSNMELKPFCPECGSNLKS